MPDSRTDLKWHAMVRLYNAFCVHAVLPRFKLSTSLPLPLRDYLHTLVKGATEEVGVGGDASLRLPSLRPCVPVHCMRLRPCGRKALFRWIF